MQTAHIGPWEFKLPDGWASQEDDAANGYVEAPDGSKGAYVKWIELAEPRVSPQALADHLQQVHEESFFELEESTWEIVECRGQSDGGLYRSALDLYDVNASYRVLSLVVSNTASAIQITIHDYSCGSCESIFADVERSIVRVPSAA